MAKNKLNQKNKFIALVWGSWSTEVSLRLSAGKQKLFVFTGKSHLTSNFFLQKRFKQQVKVTSAQPTPEGHLTPRWLLTCD